MKKAFSNILPPVSFIIILLFLLPGIALGQAGKKEGPEKFGGIGVSIDIDSAAGLPYIIEVLSGNPGAMAGLRTGDYILKINKWNTLHRSKQQITAKLRGMAGSEVALTIKRGKETVHFHIKRQVIHVDPRPENLCDGLSMMMKAVADTFSSIKGKALAEPESKNKIPDYEWVSTLTLPKFGQCRIVKKFPSESKFVGEYYVGKDSIQAVYRYDHLVSDIRDCMPYTIAESFQETNTTDITGFSTTFIISQVKENAPVQAKDGQITVQYEKLKGQPAHVFMVFKAFP